MKKMAIVIALVGMTAMFGCSQEEVVPVEEVDLIEYKDTPEGGLSDREGCLGCD